MLDGGPKSYTGLAARTSSEREGQWLVSRMASRMSLIRRSIHVQMPTQWIYVILEGPWSAHVCRVEAVHLNQPRNRRGGTW